MHPKVITAQSYRMHHNINLLSTLWTVIIKYKRGNTLLCTYPFPLDSPLVSVCLHLLLVKYISKVLSVKSGQNLFITQSTLVNESQYIIFLLKWSIIRITQESSIVDLEASPPDAVLVVVCYFSSWAPLVKYSQVLQRCRDVEYCILAPL